MKTKNKILLSSLATIALTGAMIGGSTYALFTNNTEANIAISSGKVSVAASLEDLALYSPTTLAYPSGEIVDGTNLVPEGSKWFANVPHTDGNKTEILEDGSLVLNKMSPGDRANVKVRIKNLSNVSIKYRISISKILDTGLVSGLDVVIGEDPTYKFVGSDIYTAWTPKEPETDDIVIPVSVTLPGKEGNEYQDKNCVIKFSVEAVQANALVVDDLADLSELNQVLQSSSRVNLTPFDAIVEAGGEDMFNEIPGVSYAWVRSTDQFVLIPNGQNAADPVDSYVLVNPTSIASWSTHSKYLMMGKYGTTLETSKGLDVGNVDNITSINYENSGSGQDVIIRTNSMLTDLTIDAPNDTVEHYGYVGSVLVKAIKPSSYDETGTAGRIELNSGHSEIKNGAVVFCLMENASEGKEVVPSVIEEHATVYQSKNGEETPVPAPKEYIEDCGANKHDISTLVVDDHHIYDVCNNCGFTLVHVQDSEGNEFKTTMVDGKGEIVNTPIETYRESATNVDNQVVKEKETPIVREPTKNLETGTAEVCAHEFEVTTVDSTCTQEGSKTYKCSKCEMQYSTVISKKPHAYYDNYKNFDNGKGGEETCIRCEKVATLKVAKIGETEYSTLYDAIAAVPSDGSKTEIVLLDNEGFYGNDGYEVAAGKNIVLNLNGHTIKNLVNENKKSQVFLNKGNLTIKDSTDINKNGTGKGLIVNDYAPNTATGDWWSTPQYNYATNTITNNGTLTIESGRINETATSSICYAIDNNSSAADAVLNIKGGLVTTKAPTTIRMFCNSTTKKNDFKLSGGKVSGSYTALWIQLPGSSVQTKLAHLTVTGGTLDGGSYAFYDTSNGDLYDEVKYDISGGTFNGGYAFFSYGANINITGGTFNGEVAIKQVKPSIVSVSGGTFAGDVYTYGDNATETFISGGTFLINTYEYQGTIYACDWLYKIVDGYDYHEQTIDGKTVYVVSQTNN